MDNSSALKEGFRIVLRFATKGCDTGENVSESNYCAGILTNLIMHRKNRTMIYKNGAEAEDG